MFACLLVLLIPQRQQQLAESRQAAEDEKNNVSAEEKQQRAKGPLGGITTVRVGPGWARVRVRVRSCHIDMR